MRLAIAALTAGALALATPSAATAGGLYMHDDVLAKRADSIDAALQGADVATVYAAQLANLDAAATRETLAVAQYWTTTRDNAFIDIAKGAPSPAPAAGQSVIAAGPAGSQASLLQAAACARLGQLLGGHVGAPCPTALDDKVLLADLAMLETAPQRYDELRRRQRQALMTATSWRLAFEVNAASIKASAGLASLPADDCDTLLKADAMPPALAAGELGLVQRNCMNAKDAGVDLKDFIDKLGVASRSPMRTAFANAFPPGPRPDEPDPGPEVDRRMAQAETAGREGDFAALQADLTSFMGDAGPPISADAKAAALGRLADRFRAQLQAIACPAQPAAAGANACSVFDVTSADAKAKAVWQMLQAIDQLRQAGDASRRQAQRLAAAQAIAAAAADDARRQAAEAQDTQATYGLQLLAQIREASDLARALRLLSMPDTPCGPQAMDCALSAYEASWNEGRIPAILYDYRRVQALRASGVKRAEAIAVRQQALIRSASASLKGNLDAGFTTEFLQRAARDAALIGIAVK